MMRINAVIALLACLFFIASCDEGTQGPECNTPGSECEFGDVTHADIPNLSFDFWDYFSNGYYQPKPRSFWVSPNEAIEFYEGGAVLERAEGEDAYDEQGYAAKLITRASLPPINSQMPLASGLLFSGRFTTDLSDPVNSVRFGRPFNRRLKSMSGYYKYMPVGNDACGIYAYTRKCRTMTDECGNTYNKLDTLGWARFTTSLTVEEYTRFELVLDYESLEIPDELVIYFASSDQGTLGIGGVGSTLFIDALEVEYY